LLRDITITEEDTAPLPSENKYKFSLSKLLRDKEKSNVNKAKELLKAEVKILFSVLCNINLL
jgi:hypothetical protein